MDTSLACVLPHCIVTFTLPVLDGVQMRKVVLVRLLCDLSTHQLLGGNVNGFVNFLRPPLLRAEGLASIRFFTPISDPHN